jgi:cytochrome P450
MSASELDRDQAQATARALDWRDPTFREEHEHEVYSLLRPFPAEKSQKTDEWYFLRYDDCREAFQNPELFSNNWYAADNPLGQTSVIPENSDSPEQRAYRRVLDPMFSPQAMERLEVDIRRFAVELLDPIAAKTSSEFVYEFTMPFPTIIFCRLMGFPLGDHPTLMRWKDIYMNNTSPFIAKRLGITDVDDAGRPLPEVAQKLAEETGAEIGRYLSELLDQRRAAPQDDILSRLVEAERPDGRALNQDELTRICFNLFLGGLDTVTGMLSMIIQDFAERPDHREAFVALMDDPERVGPAIEELARFHSIVTIPRRVTTGCAFRGLDLAPNEMVQLVTPSACRDESRFPGAGELDYARSPNPHLAFGLGWHRCLGIHLARRELRIGLQEIHRALPSYSLDPDHPPLVGSGGVRGLLTLPLRVGIG